MSLREIRSQLTTMKIHIDQLDAWIRQATDMIYVVEEKLMDIEDAELDALLGYKKYASDANIINLKEAASGINHFIDCPPRHHSRCSEYNMAASGFFQPEFFVKN